MNMYTDLKIIKNPDDIFENFKNLEPNYIIFAKIVKIINTLETIIEYNEDEIYLYIETSTYKQFVKEIKELYDFECSSSFSIMDNYVFIHSGDTFTINGYKFKIIEQSVTGFSNLKESLLLNDTICSHILNLICI